MSAFPDEWLEIGGVVSVNAGKRAVCIGVAPGCAHVFDGRDRLWFQLDKETPVLVRVDKVQASGAQVVATLTPGISRDRVEQLKHARVWAPAADCRARPQGAWQLEELADMTVVMRDGAVLGVVFETIPTPAGGVMRLRLTDGTTAALPVIAPLLHTVDVQAGQVVVNDPEPFLVRDDERDDDARDA